MFSHEKAKQILNKGKEKYNDQEREQIQLFIELLVEIMTAQIENDEKSSSNVPG